MRNRNHKIRRTARAVVQQWPKLAVLTLMVSLLSWPLSSRVQAAAGDLDPTFGIDGKVTTDLFAGDDIAFALAIQPDGKLIAAGRTDNAITGFDFALARYNSNGSLDSSFGSAGKVSTDFFGNLDIAVAVAIQPDGKIIVAGQVFDAPGNNILFGLARYNTNGSLDSTFGSGGKVTGGGRIATSLLIQPDGRILVGGNTIGSGLPNNSDFDLVRYIWLRWPVTRAAGAAIKMSTPTLPNPPSPRARKPSEIVAGRFSASLVRVRSGFAFPSLLG